MLRFILRKSELDLHRMHKTEAWKPWKAILRFHNAPAEMDEARIAPAEVAIYQGLSIFHWIFKRAAWAKLNAKRA